jgi:hypothetical protein
VDRRLIARLRVGGTTMVLAEGAEGIELQSPQRLEPGRPLDVVLPDQTGAPIVRRALLWSWRLVRWDDGVPLYRGICRWTDQPVTADH